MTTRRVWTPEDIDLLAREWVAGTPTKIIADKIGVTQASVISMAYARRLPLRKPSYTPHTARRVA